MLPPGTVTPLLRSLQQESWIEKKLKPKKVNARYPIKGAPLLYATCAFVSLGDALFGYNSGTRIWTCAEPELTEEIRYHVGIACQSRVCVSVLP